ncbi:MAG: RidA family protein [Steroidobacteraceae bacterium]
MLTALVSSARAAEPANVGGIRAINAPNVPQPAGGYSQAVEVTARRLLFISGQIPVDDAGEVPADFDAQCRLVWAAIDAQLRAAGMEFRHLVKVTTYLSDRRFAGENSRIRREVLGSHAPALTVVITGIYDPRWYLEIEAVADD